MEHRWTSAHNRFTDVILPLLEAQAKEIGKASESGNADAEDVIHYYKLLKKSFDPIMLIQLERALTKYGIKI